MCRVELRLHHPVRVACQDQPDPQDARIARAFLFLRTVYYRTDPTATARLQVAIRRKFPIDIRSALRTC